MPEIGRGAFYGDETPILITHIAVVCVGYCLISLVEVVELSGAYKLCHVFQPFRLRLYCLYIGAQVDGDFLKLFFPLLLELFLGISIEFLGSDQSAQLLALLLHVVDGKVLFKEVHDLVSPAVDFLDLRLVYGFVAARFHFVYHFLLLRVVLLEFVEEVGQHFRLGFIHHGLGGHLYALFDVVALHVVGVNQV